MQVNLQLFQVICVHLDQGGDVAEVASHWSFPIEPSDVFEGGEVYVGVSTPAVEAAAEWVCREVKRLDGGVFERKMLEDLGWDAGHICPTTQSD